MRKKGEMVKQRQKTVKEYEEAIPRKSVAKVKSLNPNQIVE
jgi:hypothetical protein